MHYCPNCGDKLEASPRFCSHCGATLGRPDANPSLSQPSGRVPSRHRHQALAVGLMVTGLAVLLVCGGAGLVLATSGDDDRTVSQRTQAPTQRPSVTTRPTPRGPNLTGAEAAGKVNAFVLRDIIKAGGAGSTTAVCEPEEFNELFQKWIVNCAIVLAQSAFTIRFNVDDATGTVTMID